MTDIQPNELIDSLGSGGTVLIDVREPVEHMQERIPGGRLVPVEKLSAAALADLPAGTRVCLYCRTGRRAAVAARRLEEAGISAANLAGGIEGWKQGGHEVESTPGAPRFTIMQQVMMTMGVLTLASVGLGFLVAPAWFALAGFVGAGQLFAA